MSTLVVNEASALFLTFTFYDEAGNPVTPTTVDWRLDDITDPHTPVEIRAWTSLTPGNPINAQVTGAQNAMQDPTRNYEERLVTVKTDDGLSTQGTEDMKYRVKNRLGVP